MARKMRKKKKEPEKMKMKDDKCLTRERKKRGKGLMMYT